MPPPLNVVNFRYVQAGRVGREMGAWRGVTGPRHGVCRWGILGTADIARKNWPAIALAGNAAVTAVTSRSLDRSSQFVARCLAARNSARHG